MRSLEPDWWVAVPGSCLAETSSAQTPALARVRSVCPAACSRDSPVPLVPGLALAGCRDRTRRLARWRLPRLPAQRMRLLLPLQSAEVVEVAHMVVQMEIECRPQMIEHDLMCPLFAKAQVKQRERRPQNLAVPKCPLNGSDYQRHRHRDWDRPQYQQGRNLSIFPTTAHSTLPRDNLAHSPHLALSP